MWLAVNFALFVSVQALIIVFGQVFNSRALTESYGTTCIAANSPVFAAMLLTWIAPLKVVRALEAVGAAS